MLSRDGTPGLIELAENAMFGMTALNIERQYTTTSRIHLPSLTCSASSADVEARGVI
jgi:hypothetical protein